MYVFIYLALLLVSWYIISCLPFISVHYMRRALCCRAVPCHLMAG